ncbi:MAG: hypothetical protein GX816_01650 [Erysipelotrichia bacterium]|jgi:hypothetical protein|nr:hypothetical protein [Bacilli bacterium]MDD4005739.1 hypothetical protein [Bacilli bacterium]NMV82241.1 hypothetical protein [Erysipelotrichia bacterium]
MIKFLQFFGQGLLYVVLSPIFLLILALYVVYTSIVMVLLFFKMIILFFAGKNIFGDLPEDIEAAKIIEAHRQAKQAQANPQQPPYPYPFPPPYGYPGYSFPQQPGQIIDQPDVKEIEAKPVDEEKDGEQ